MTNNAYIKLVPASAKESITKEELKNLFLYYKEITAKTGKQVGWNYDAAAFPYEIEEKTGEKGDWLYLYSNQDRYHAILVGIVNNEKIEGDGTKSEQTVIQVTLPPTSTYGDKGKATEFCKFLGKKLKGELHLFNSRIMYYYPRK